MAEFKCGCGKECKNQSQLYSHGTKSKKTINNGNGCPIYQQRKREGLPINIVKIEKEKNIDDKMQEIINSHDDYKIKYEKFLIIYGEAKSSYKILYDIYLSKCLFINDLLDDRNKL